MAGLDGKSGQTNITVEVMQCILLNNNLHLNRIGVTMECFFRTLRQKL